MPHVDLRDVVVVVVVVVVARLRWSAMAEADLDLRRLVLLHLHVTNAHSVFRVRRKLLGGICANGACTITPCADRIVDYVIDNNGGIFFVFVNENTPPSLNFP